MISKQDAKFPEKVPPRSVVVLIKGDVPLNWDLLRWFQSNNSPRWNLTVIGSMLLDPWEQIRRLQPDGLLIHANLWDDLPKDVLADIPIVGLMTRSFCDATQPMVVIDEDKATAMVVHHFSGAGFTHFAYLGFEGFKSSAEKAKGLQAAAAEVGGTYEVYDGSLFPVSFKDDTSKKKQLTDWLQKLPKPVGIFAQNDMWANLLIEVCLRAGFQIPDQVAVVGMNNDLVVCEGCEIPISSIVPDLAGIGRHAQAMLETLMQGKPVHRPVIAVPPLALEIRRSSDIRLINNSPLARACDYIRRESSNRIRVQEVVAASGIARRSLERNFRKQVGRSIHEEIQRIRLEHAKKLLHETDEILKVIAHSSGFSNTDQLAYQFEREYSCTPTAWREQDRARALQKINRPRARRRDDECRKQSNG